MLYSIPVSSITSYHQRYDYRMTNCGNTSSSSPHIPHIKSVQCLRLIYRPQSTPFNDSIRTTCTTHFLSGAFSFQQPSSPWRAADDYRGQHHPTPDWAGELAAALKECVLVCYVPWYTVFRLSPLIISIRIVKRENCTMTV